MDRRDRQQLKFPKDWALRFAAQATTNNYTVRHLPIHPNFGACLDYLVHIILYIIIGTKDIDAALERKSIHILYKRKDSN